MENEELILLLDGVESDLYWVEQNYGSELRRLANLVSEAKDIVRQAGQNNAEAADKGQGE